MKLSLQQTADIYSAWSQHLAPTDVAKALRLAPLTIIREYIRLDNI
jgi:hypothetical protein